MKITGDMLIKYGYTEGCDGCRTKRAGVGQMAHSEECRERIMEALGGDPEGEEKRRRNTERENQAIAERMAKWQKEKEEQAENQSGEGQPDEVCGPATPMNPQGHDDMDLEAERTSADPATPTREPQEPNRGGDIAEPLEDDRRGLRRPIDTDTEDYGPEEENPGKRRRGEEVEATEAPGARSDNEMDPGDDMAVTSIMESLNSVSIDILELQGHTKVHKEGSRFDLKVGQGLDLATGWDFRKTEHRRKVMEQMDKLKPKLVIGSPMCAIFSELQQRSRWTSEKQRRWIEATTHLEFMIEVYRRQQQAGRWFLHEQPAGASSWGIRAVQNLMAQNGVHVGTADWCQYGMMSYDKKMERLHQPGVAQGS